jgi:hypothetical protein
MVFKLAAVIFKNYALWDVALCSVSEICLWIDGKVVPYYTATRARSIVAIVRNGCTFPKHMSRFIFVMEMQYFPCNVTAWFLSPRSVYMRARACWRVYDLSFLL